MQSVVMRFRRGCVDPRGGRWVVEVRVVEGDAVHDGEKVDKGRDGGVCVVDVP